MKNEELNKIADIDKKIEIRIKEKPKSQWFSKIAYLIGLIFLFFLGLIFYAYLIS